MKNILRPLILLVLLWQQTTLAAQVPLLSSYPSARAVIFLDFDGHTVTGTSWNYLHPIIACEPSGLNEQQIREVFNRIAEDYRPFNINITTDSTKYFAAPANKRTRVILTVTSSWYGSAGGVAWTGSFTWGDETPCFVFSGLLGYTPKRVAEAASHEAGHTLGLAHQSKYDGNCLKLSDYDTGQGTGEIGWAPIMGMGYYQNFTLWHNGPNSWGCTNYQSDLDIITSSTNGFGYRTDDHGNNFGAATVPTFSSNRFEVTGVIERNTDQDFFRFIMPAAGRFQIDAVPYNVGTGNAGSDLDMQVTLYNQANQPLSVYNPGALLNSVADTLLSAGTYYLKIEGKGNLYAPAYASLGSYSLEARIGSNEAALPLRLLRLQAQLDGDKHRLSWAVDADEKISEQVLEASTDGRFFEALTELTSDKRSYTYRPSSTATVQYRVKVVFENGHRYYSNVATIREADLTTRPRLLSTVLQSGTLSFSSPGSYQYRVFDSQGRVLADGLLTKGIQTVQVSQMTAGLYFVRFTGDGQQWTDKLIRN